MDTIKNTGNLGDKGTQQPGKQQQGTRIPGQEGGLGRKDDLTKKGNLGGDFGENVKK